MKGKSDKSAAVVIVAAGRGTRAGGDLPKQWQPLAGRRVIDWTLAAFRGVAGIESLVVVLRDEDRGRIVGSDVILATGGETRAASVLSGLEALSGRGIDHVLIHDAARATVPRETIGGVLSMLADHDAVAPGLPLTDALWTADPEGKIVTGMQDRTGLFHAQTPQGFRYDDILVAHRAHKGEAADDVAVARAAGMTVAVAPGHPDNIKITSPADFTRAERILKGQEMDIRLGNGFDVHRFAPGDHVTLCGVRVPFERSLKGHSDADVAMHAATDAIYGALAEGDIGRHFPPSDPAWKGAASNIFLDHAIQRAGTRGFAISNVDITIICEAPKIGPHAAVMQSELARIMSLDADRISVKATTSEKLGFTGRGEGIAAMATATLVKR